ncbi:MAG: S41 family peptidase [Flavobacteriales bacterium]|nr:S41 family peptidase [Flavobacteriales bacterium]
MRKITIFLGLIIAVVLSTSCEKVFMDKEISADAVNNFNTLADVIDKKYSYLVLKDIDWNSIVNTYRDSIHNGMNILEEFRIYDEMLYKLRDGHVNLYSGFDVGRNWEWYLNSPSNFDWNLIEREYLGDDYYISGGLKHKVIGEEDDKYSYVYYGSFSSGLSYIDFVKILGIKSKSKGIIIDVRNNGGGYLSNAEDFASHFVEKKRVGYKELLKSGPAHDQFSDTLTTYIEPLGEKWTKPIVVLTNRKCFSSTSFFTTMMKELPNVTVLGDSTGGGAGLPVDYTLPNGWIMRYSTTRAMDARGVDFELGVEADEYLNLDSKDVINGKDTLIERAKEIIDGET